MTFVPLHAEDGIAAGLKGFDQAIANARAELADIEKAQQGLRIQEPELDKVLTSEEQQWTSFSVQLQELEQAVSKSTKPR